jgi:hypothetical protein
MLTSSTCFPVHPHSHSLSKLYNLFIGEGVVKYTKKQTQHLFLYCHNSSVGIATGYGLDDLDSRVWLPAVAGNFSFHHCVQNGSGAHPASYPMGTRGSIPGSKVARAWSWPHSPPSSAEVKEWMELYLHSPNTPSWLGAQLKKHRDNFTFTLTFYLYCFYSLMVADRNYILKPDDNAAMKNDEK